MFEKCFVSQGPCAAQILKKGIGVALLAFLTATWWSACSSCSNGPANGNGSNHQSNGEAFTALAPAFNADSAYFFIQKQVDFGPRVPNTAAHDSCAQWLRHKLDSYGAEVIVQKATVKAWNDDVLHIQNIIAEFNPGQKPRVLLCAHWDTRPWAEHDVTRTDEPIPGANDGGSGVGVLLEIARQLAASDLPIGVDIILFDAEDYGNPQYNHSYCLGSQHWGNNPHRKKYFASYGILLDMVGAKNSVFSFEGTSVKYAERVLRKVWNIAARLGYSRYFSFQETAPVTDDHLYINQLTGIKTIDIIQRDLSTPTQFGSYWHTHDDDMDIISRETLKAVGQTVLETLFQEGHKAS